MLKISFFLVIFFSNQFLSAQNRVNSTSIAVETFGAKGDGVTDDTYAIQKAINSSYGTINFSNKNYIVNGQVNLKSNKKLIGNQTLISRNQINSNQSIIYGENVSYINISNIKFRGNVSKQSPKYLSDASVIRIDDSNNINLSNISTSGGSSGVQIYYSDKITIEGLISENNILTGLSAIANNITLSNSKLTHNGYTSNGLTHDAYFINSSNVQIKDSTFGNTNDQKAFSLVVRYDLSDAKPLFDTVDNINIFNNTFYNNGLAVGSDPGVEVKKRKPPKNVKIYNNNFNGSDLKIDDPESIVTNDNQNITNYICRVGSSYPQYNVGLISTNDHCKNLVQSSLKSIAEKSTSSIIFSNTVIDNGLSNGIQNAQGFGGVKAFTLKKPKVNGQINFSSQGENSKVKINK